MEKKTLKRKSFFLSGRKSVFFVFWVFTLLSLLAILPLFKPYVLGTADGLGHRFRLISFFNSLKEGNWRPRWAGEAALGYGAPTFLFNYPLPYYLASFFHFLGFSINTSGQILAAFSLFFSGFFMYLAAKKLGEKEGKKDNLAGLTAAVLYTYAPYHLQMTYLYDSWGEELAFVFPPLILYLILCLRECFSGNLSIKRQKSDFKLKNFKFCPLYFFLFTIVWALFVLSHNLSAFIFSPLLLGLAGLLLGFCSRSFLLVLNGFVLAFIISAFFWLPAFALQNEMKYPEFIASEKTMLGSFFKSFSFQWKTAFLVIKEGKAHYLDFTVGWPIFLLGIMGGIRLMGLIRRIKVRGFTQEGGKFLLLVFLLLALFFSLYLTNYYSHWVWRLPFFSYPLSFVLYPFRFLFLASFLGALLGGLLIKKLPPLIAFIIIALAFIQGWPYTKPYVEIFPFPSSYFYQPQTVTRAPWTLKNMLIKEFLPKGADLSFLAKEEGKAKEAEIEMIEGKGKIKEIKSQAEKVEAKIHLEKEGVIRVNRFYFPNWEIKANGVKKNITKDEVGRMVVRLREGEYHFILLFGKSKIEKIGDILAILGLVVLGGEVVVLKKYLSNVQKS